MKTELKVVLFSCGGMLFVAILVIGGIVRFFFSAADNIKKVQEAAHKEYVRVESLNTIKGVVINDAFYTAPFSNDTVGLCFLKIARKITYSGGGAHGRHHSSHSGPKWKYDTQYIVVRNPGVRIKVGTETYPVDFNHILAGFSKSNTPNGYLGATFDTESKYANSLSDLYIALREDKKAWDEKEKKYNQNVEKTKALYGVDEKIDRFLDNEVFGKKTAFSHLRLSEILYKVGDSIAIKGKIENGHIIPLY